MGNKSSRKKYDPVKHQIESIYTNFYGQQRIYALEKLLSSIDYKCKYKNLIIQCIIEEQNKLK